MENNKKPLLRSFELKVLIFNNLFFHYSTFGENIFTPKVKKNIFFTIFDFSLF